MLRWKAFDLECLNMQFHKDWPEDKKYSFFMFFPENLEKFRLTERYGAPLERSTIFSYRSSTRRTPLDSSRLSELKYPFFSRRGRNTKKLRRSNLFPLTIFKHGLLEGSTFFSNTAPKPYKVGKLSIRRVKICNFSRIGRKTEE